jgi:hypothetical protein
VAGSLGILVALEERSEIKKVLKSASIDCDRTVDTYTLVQTAIDHALARYGVADLVALGKNRKFSSHRSDLPVEVLEETKATYRAKLNKMDKR